MLAVCYFDWDGPRDSVKEFGEMLSKGCEKAGVKFHGIWNPGQDKWNFVAIMEADTYELAHKAFSEAGGMHKNMPHAIMKYFTKQYP